MNPDPGLDALRDLDVVHPDVVHPQADARLVDGRTFAFEAEAETPAIWGEHGEVAWAKGEGMMVAGPQGVGKSTLVQRLILARIGILTHVIGLKVERDERGVLYLALDRPRQIARSVRRMVDEEKHGARLKERLIVWRGPLPFDPLSNAEALANFARSQGVGTLAIDSTKDLAADLGDGATGAILNTAFQHVLAAGIELVVVHHPRKGQTGNPKPKTLDDVYGATWLTAGMGSVVYLYGKPGDPIVEFLHLKQPQEEVGPWTLLHDHERGAIDLYEPVELAQLLAASSPAGLTARTAAAAIFSTEAPSPAEVEKARRKLERSVQDGHADRLAPDQASGEVRYVERRP